MNILIPHHWLLDHLQTNAAPEDIQKYLSLSGPSIEHILTIEGEPVYDVEVTTNRVDSMSVRGLAREAAAILPQFNITANLKPLELPELTNDQLLELTIENDPELCDRILAIKLNNVQTGISPDWLQKRLLQVDQRPLNNAIDITNYVMWDIGHPIHAFDYDRLTQKTIIVRSAQAGETLVTLDNQKKTMEGGEVIFDDGTGTIIDFPGIMGTKNTVVTQDTNTVLLWIESIQAKKIRYASMIHDLRSQAAVLNEKHVDPHLADATLKKAIKLYQEITTAKLGSQLRDIFPNHPEIKTTTLNETQIKNYLGIELQPNTITDMLERLEITVKVDQSNAQTSYHLTPPSYRANDLAIPADYIEEIARLYGFHELPTRLLPHSIPDTKRNADFQFENTIKHWLSGWGAIETYTYSMISQKQAQTGSHQPTEHLKLANPLSKDMVYLRRSLIPSLITVVDNNPQHQPTLFELQNVYHPVDNNLPEEQLTLAILSTHNYRHLKGILDALMQKLHINDYQVIPLKTTHKPWLEGKSGTISVADEPLGIIGQLNTQKPVYALELNAQKLQTHYQSHPRYLPSLSHPPIIEDLTFKMPPKTPIQPIINTIQEIDKFIEEVEYKTAYQQNFTFTIHYRHPEKNLTDKEVAPLRHQIVKTLEEKHNAQLVGELQ